MWQSPGERDGLTPFAALKGRRTRILFEHDDPAYEKRWPCREKARLFLEKPVEAGLDPTA